MIKMLLSAAEANIKENDYTRAGEYGGDALGYEVEFLGEAAIFARFGEGGITEYVLRNGVAEISDDTQWRRKKL